MKKLIPALCMLLIAAALLGTSTYAWFSMNSTVTANGMTITAKSETVFLQISKTESFNTTGAQVEANLNVKSTDGLRPTAAYSSISSEGALVTPGLGTAFADVKFAQAFSSAPETSAKTEDTDYEDVTSNAKTAAGNAYTLINSVWVRLNPAAGAGAASDLKVSSVSLKTVDASGVETTNDAMKSAVRVLVVCDSAWTIWNAATGTVIASSADGNVILETVTETAKEIQIYVYFDGEDPNATSVKAEALSTDGYQIGVEFTCGTAVTTP